MGEAGKRNSPHLPLNRHRRVRTFDALHSTVRVSDILGPEESARIDREENEARALVRSLGAEVNQDTRETVAAAAAKAALDTVPEQYQGGPIGRNIAITAARMALGLEPIPEEPTQGEPE